MEIIAIVLVIAVWVLHHKKIKSLSDRIQMLEGENDQVVKQINVMLEEKGS